MACIHSAPFYLHKRIASDKPLPLVVFGNDGGKSEDAGQAQEHEKLLGVLKYVLRDMEYEKGLKEGCMPAEIFEDFIDMIVPNILSSK